MRRCGVLFVKQLHKSFLGFVDTMDFRASLQQCQRIAPVQLWLTLSDMCHVLCVNWCREKGCRNDRWMEGHREARGIRVDSFGPDIMYLPGLQHTLYLLHVSVASDLKKNNKKNQDPFTVIICLLVCFIKEKTCSSYANKKFWLILCE